MKKLTQIALAVAALAAAVDASAAVQTYTVNSNVLNYTKSSAAGALDFAKFDATLGTLESVQVQLFSNLGTTVKVENTSTSSASTIKATAGALLTFTLSGVSQTLTSSDSHTFNASVFDGLSNYAGTSGGSYTFSSPFSSSSTYSDAASLALFSGTGSAHANLAASTTSVIAGISGNTRSLVLPSFSGYAKVTYTYATPVPEPETYAMLLGGLALVGAIARRRKSA
ncbi:choice-of-anchor E domain-containing protein [Duganella callida]|uniref:PEP-CTERM sorting domain-containing protein n=1 Tax=Duganella callida TaxID=2561932 RepID=A0A4Y9RYA1_9BURK|nr:choice-of-anchor E domain-containing protein [Duganella callida]TFW13952.1 PEP-CTERM sorting domain-containing protein [Duganella callida]